MPSEFENTIAEFITANGLFAPPGGILLAVSGGADSMALMHILHSLADRLAGRNLIFAHINHQLRGADADADEAFVIEHAKKLGLPVITKRLPVAAVAKEQKLSIETAARQMRMNALSVIAKENRCTYIATAHHKDDNAETIVHRLLRGTGFRGLAGIRPTKKFENEITFVRPLLCVTRDQIISYLTDSQIPWRRDHTNDDQAYTRNFIRHSLLPALQRQSRDSLPELLYSLSINCRKYIDSLDTQIDSFWPQLVSKQTNDRIELNFDAFNSVPIPLKHEIIRRALIAIGSGERDLTQFHYQDVLHLIESDKPRKSLTLPHGFAVHRGCTIIFEKSGMPQPDSCPWQIETCVLDAKDCDLQKFKTDKTLYIEWFDADKIVSEVTIRPRKPGDRFWPIGLAAPKKIGKFLTDAHIDDELRKSACVVEDGQKIIWLMPLRASDQTKVTAATKKILQIVCSPRKTTTP